MEPQGKNRASGPRFEAMGVPDHLRPASSTEPDDIRDFADSHDAGSQAWGDYLEEIEGYEI
jgi:hypothetical protein